MKTAFFFVEFFAAIAWFYWWWKRPPSRHYKSIDAIVPAYNEELCLQATVEPLLRNRYINRVIVVNDGSTDRTAEILDWLASIYPRVIPVHQKNTGKGGAIMNGVAHAESPYVFLTDADTDVPPESNGLGYLLAELERGADAAGGIPASNLNGAGLLPHTRAAVKVPMISIQRTFQQLTGGAPFIISGACGLFKAEVLREVPFSDRTKVEDLDLTWSLVSRGFKISQSVRCIVYSQECNELKAEWLRWRRWIIGYAVCMRLHPRLLLSRFGIFSILPMFWTAVGGAAYTLHSYLPVLAQREFGHLPDMMFPIVWVCIVCLIGLFSAIHQRRVRLIAFAPLGIFYLFFAYAIWMIHGVKGLFTGKEPERDKPVRYANVVG